MLMTKIRNFCHFSWQKSIKYYKINSLWIHAHLKTWVTPSTTQDNSDNPNPQHKAFFYLGPKGHRQNLVDQAKRHHGCVHRSLAGWNLQQAASQPIAPWTTDTGSVCRLGGDRWSSKNARPFERSASDHRITRYTLEMIRWTRGVSRWCHLHRVCEGSRKS